MPGTTNLAISDVKSGLSKYYGVLLLIFFKDNINTPAPTARVSIGKIEIWPFIYIHKITHHALQFIN